MGVGSRDNMIGYLWVDLKKLKHSKIQFKTLEVDSLSRREGYVG